MQTRCTMKVIFLLLLLGIVKSQKNDTGVKFYWSKRASESDKDLQDLISDILFNSLAPYKCVAIICDRIYYNIFEEKMYLQFGAFVTFLIVVVEDYEDLLSPFESTQESLNMAKARGCQFYIILVSNGIQTTRLLRFGDRYRILNTRANYIMLWERRLFHKDLYYIWKRIINVVFIREFVGTKKSPKVANNSSLSGSASIPWFEISTVPFPSPLRGVLMPKRLDTWRRSKFRSGGTDLFRDKTSDLMNQTLRVVTFPHIPATAKIKILPSTKTVRSVIRATSSSRKSSTHQDDETEEEYGFVGIEVEVLETLSAAMNFRADLYEPPNADVELWGEKQADGKYTGITGEMVASSADMALGDLHYTPHFLELMDLSTPYNTECLTFLTPESLTNNSWKTLILPFKPFMWLAIVMFLLLTGLIFYSLSRFHKGLNRIIFKDLKRQKNDLREKIEFTSQIVRTSSGLNSNEMYILMKQQYEPNRIEGEPQGLYLFGELSNSILYTFGMLLFISLPKLPTGWSIRMLTGWYWLYCILLVVAYKASMTAILANPAPKVTIDSLQQLVDSELSCGGHGEINRQFFKTSLDPASQTIGERFVMVNDTGAAVDKIMKGKFAMFENAHFLKDASVRRRLGSQLVQLDSTTSEIYENETVTLEEEVVDVASQRGHNVHIMTDCIIHMPISIGLQKNSPIKPRVDKFIRRVIEAGLITKWLNDVMLPANNAEIHLEPTDATTALMNMDKLFAAIVALLVGYIISVITLLGEIIYFQFAVKRHPNFDKYSRQIVEKRK